MSSPVDDADEMTDHELFDTAESKVEYHRSRDTKRVTITVKDQKGISEMKLYLLLVMEVEKLEARLGISEADEGRH